MMKILVNISMIVLVLVFLYSCSSVNKSTSPNKTHTTQKILPGVDSLVAAKADSIADLHFVDYSRRIKSSTYYDNSLKFYNLCDTLWQAANKSSNNSPINDSINIPELYKKGCLYLENKKSDCSKNINKNPTHKDIQSLLINLIDKAQKYAITSKNTNPFNLQTRLNLIQIYMLQAKINDKQKYYELAITEINGFLEYERSLSRVYILLAKCYYALSDWSKAYDNFCMAQDVLEKTTVFQNTDTETNIVKLVYLLQQQADAKAKMYDDSTALVLLQKARSSAKSFDKQQQIDRYIKWINWDDGNIKAVEERDEILKLIKQKKYKKANKKFKELLPLLKTQRTKNIINWNIATTDFEILNNKKEGIKRLFNVVKNIPTEDLNDSTSVIYLTDYGAMCYSRGIDFLKKNDNRIAYMYFNQAARLKWAGQGKCYFQLAKLSQVNHVETIKNCQNALNFKEQLNQELEMQIYELLVNAYKSNGDFKLAREYFGKLTR